MAQHKRKKRKQRPVKTYDIKALKRKWKWEDWQRKNRRADRTRTSPIVLLCCAAVFLAFGIFGSIVFWYTPPASYEQATVVEASFDRYVVSHAVRGGTDRDIVLSDGERYNLCGFCADDALEARLYDLPKNTPITLRIDDKGFVVEIIADGETLLPYEEGVRDTQAYCTMWFCIWIGIQIIAIAIAVYAVRRIVKDRV